MGLITMTNSRKTKYTAQIHWIEKSKFRIRIFKDWKLINEETRSSLRAAMKVASNWTGGLYEQKS